MGEAHHVEKATNSDGREFITRELIKARFGTRSRMEQKLCRPGKHDFSTSNTCNICGCHRDPP